MGNVALLIIRLCSIICRIRMSILKKFGCCLNSIGKHDFYFRQLKDMKTSIKLKGMSARSLKDYGEICGSALARARTGDSALISGYLGKSEAFDQAMTNFATAYADQAQQDHRVLVEAVQSGQLEAKEG